MTEAILYQALYVFGILTIPATLFLYIGSFLPLRWPVFLWPAFSTLLKFIIGTVFCIFVGNYCPGGWNTFAAPYLKDAATQNQVAQYAAYFLMIPVVIGSIRFLISMVIKKGKNRYVQIIDP
jgi:multisubunit Na+/H+ antiporter MnhB subunit